MHLRGVWFIRMVRQNFLYVNKIRLYDTIFNLYDNKKGLYDISCYPYVR